MTITQIILEDLDPIIIETLKTRAEKHGNSLQAEIKTILQQVIQAEAEKNQPSEQRIAAFKEWVESHRNINFPTLSDEAISREMIYGDRG